MLRSELIDALASRFPQLTPTDADLVVKEIIDTMSQALARGQRIEIRGFGSFALHHRDPRVGRNPKTGRSVEVAAPKMVRPIVKRHVSFSSETSNFAKPIDAPITISKSKFFSCSCMMPPNFWQ